jgi:succinoglycan biosynthesis protein ExoO
MVSEMAEATVIIAAWNAEAFIAKSIESALNQNGAAVQVVVVDDASTDRTGEIAAEYNVDYIRLSENGGPAKARNAGLAHATKDWVAVLDSDDTMSPHRIASMIEFAEKNSADIVLGNFDCVDEFGAHLESSDLVKGLGGAEAEPLSVATYLAQNQFGGTSPQTGYLKPLFRRSTLVQEDLKYDESLRNSEDFHIILRAIALGAKTVVSTAPDYQYTVRAGSISHRVDTEKLMALQNADLAFEQEFGPHLSAHSLELLEQRRRSLAEIVDSEVVLAHLKKGKLHSAIGAATRKPKSLRRVFRQLAEAVSNRIAPSKSRF